MESKIRNLATNIIAVLTTYLTETPEAFIRAAGQSDYEKTGSLLVVLKRRWIDDEEATQILVRFEEKPERYRSILADILQEKLAQDKALADELAQRLRQIKLILEVDQTGDKVEEITGIEGQEMLGGRIKVTQKIKQGQKVTGIKLDRLGKS